MAITRVQSTKKVVSGVNTTTLAFTSPLTAGNLLCVSHAHWNPNLVAISTPTDTLGNLYAPMTAEQGTGAQRLRSFYVEDCAAGACTVTFDMAGATTGDLTVVIAEYSGVPISSSLDQTQVGTGTGTAVSSGSTATTSQADELVWGAMAHDGSNMALTETGSATLVQENEGGSADMPIATSERIVAAAAAYAATWTIGTSATWWAHVATFKAGAAVGISLDQEGFRWRNDDGSEATATWKAAQDTNVTVNPDETARLRFIVNATGDPANAQYKLQYRKVGAASWRDIDTSG